MDDRLNASHIAQVPDTAQRFLTDVPTWQGCFDEPEGRDILTRYVAADSLIRKIAWRKELGIDCFATQSGRLAALDAVNRPAIQAGTFIAAQAAAKVARQATELDPTVRQERIRQALTEAFDRFAAEYLITWESLWPGS